MRYLLIATLLLIPTIATAAYTVAIQWDANADTTIGYRLCYGQYSGNVKKFVFVNCSTVKGKTNTTKTISGLSDVQKWFFRVNAYDEFMTSDWSNYATINTVKTPTATRFQKIEIR